jgi:hypothetical protein
MFRKLLLEEIDNIPKKHSDHNNKYTEHKSNAASNVWKCLERLAKRFCFTYCVGCCEDDKSVYESWEDLQDEFHEALSYLPEIHRRAKECPACIVVKAFKTFPLIAFHSPIPPSGMGFRAREEKDGTFTVFGKDNALLKICLAESKRRKRTKEQKEHGYSDYEQTPLPCCQFTMTMEIDNEEFEDEVIRRRELTLLNLDLRSLSTMHPVDKERVNKWYNAGQQVLRNINKLIHPEKWCEEDGIFVSSKYYDESNPNSALSTENRKESHKVCDSGEVSSEQSSSTTLISDPLPRNYIWKKGECWAIRFENGEEKTYKSDIGFYHLQQLLKSPGTGISAAELDRNASIKTKNSLQHLAVKGEDFTENDDVQKLGRFDAGEILDPEAIESCKKRQIKIEEALEVAREKQDLETIDDLENEMIMINSELTKAQGLNGRSRSIADEKNKIRNRVCTAVKRALEKIEQHDKLLSEHLKKPALTFGYNLCYTPSTSIEWSTS